MTNLPERKVYHAEQDAHAEKEKQWFAVAFHLGRLLLDDPDNAKIKKRRAEAMQKHAAPAKKYPMAKRSDSSGHARGTGRVAVEQRM